MAKGIAALERDGGPDGGVGEAFEVGEVGAGEAQGQRDDVVLYLSSWADLLERDLLAGITLPSFVPAGPVPEMVLANSY